jgi:hypothetical protein
MTRMMRPVREEASRAARDARDALVVGLRGLRRGELTRADVVPLAEAYRAAILDWARVSGVRIRPPSVAYLLRALG